MPGPRGPRGPKPKIENPGKLMKRLMGYVLKKYGALYALVIIGIVASVMCNTQGTMFMQKLIDDYITPMINNHSTDYAPLLQAIGKVAGFYALGVAATFMYNKLLIYISQGTIMNLRNDLFTHMQDLPIRYFDTHSHGDIMSIYTNDIDTLRQMISQSIPQLLNSIITIVNVFIYMVILNIPLTILTLVMVAITVFVTGKFAGFSSRYFLAQQQDLGKVNGFIEEMLNGQKVVKVFTHEQQNIEDFNKLNDQLYDSAYNANRYSNALGPVNAQIGNISYVLCAMIGGVMALAGFSGLTLGKLASFLTFNKSFNMPISQVSMQLNSVVMAMAGSERIFKLLDEEPETDEGYVTLVNAKEENGQLTAVMQNGQRFTADTIAVCIGVRMNVGFLRESGLTIGRGLQVDKHMQTNYEGIYAAGDCCEALDIQSQQHKNIGVWLNANSQGKVAGNNMAGGNMEFDANVLVNLARYLNYDFVSIGDVSTCKPEDELYEFENDRYYIRGVRDESGAIKCLNIIHSADSNGVIKNIFIKYFENKSAGLDPKSASYLREAGYPDSFIHFLGGRIVD